MVVCGEAKEAVRCERQSQRGPMEVIWLQQGDRIVTGEHWKEGTLG